MDNEKDMRSFISSKSELLRLLRSPVELKPLDLNNFDFRTGDGETYPIIDGIICLLKEDERNADLGDGKFYDSNPFGARDWSDPGEVEAGVEDDIKKLLERYKKNDFIIDVGAGTGRISNYLSTHGFHNVISLDYSLVSLKEIEKNSDNLCVWGNNLCLPIASNSFDLAISTGVIHHISDSEKALAECARILKPGGRLYLRTRNIHSLYGYLFYTYGALLRFFESNRYTKFLSDLLGFEIYKIARRIFYRNLPKRDDLALRAKYANLFTKRMIRFFTTGKVKKMLNQNGLRIEYGRKVSFTHRQHFYVASKNTNTSTYT